MSPTTPNRPYGSGSLFVRGGSWYGQWRVDGRQLKRRLGSTRPPGTRGGLTRSQAERELRRRMQDRTPAPVGRAPTVEETGECYLRHLEARGERKRSTLQDYRILLARHLAPQFGSKPIDRLSPEDVEVFLAAQARSGAARQSVLNRLNLLSGLCGYAVKRRWIAANPVAAVERPRAAGADPDIRFLGVDEVEAVIRAVPEDTLGPTERTLYLTAAMTGLRQGELVALRWRDVDWPARLVRVRRSYTRGEFGTPKSRRSSRAVPMADRVAAELERHFQRSGYTADDDLVLCHPETGTPFDASKMRKRFKAAVARAGVREVRFHDLRHTYGTAMAGAGAPLRSLMEWMGHADLSTTLRYADYSPQQAQGAAFAERAFSPSSDGEGCLGGPPESGNGDRPEGASPTMVRTNPVGTG